MKTKQAIVTVALSTLALSAFAGSFPGNPERDAIDESLGTSIVVSDVNDGWKDYGAERGVQFVGGSVAKSEGGYAYSKEDILQARMDYKESPN